MSEEKVDSGLTLAEAKELPLEMLQEALRGWKRQRKTWIDYSAKELIRINTYIALLELAIEGKGRVEGTGGSSE